MSEDSAPVFPPRLDRGARVQSRGEPLRYGIVEEISKPYDTVDQLLFTIRWDDGSTTREYGSKLFCIGRFQNRAEFDAAITPVSAATVTEGPRGGFKSASLALIYEGHSRGVRITDRALWADSVEPRLRALGLETKVTRLRNAK